MSAAGEAVELLMAARSRVLGAEDLVFIAFKASWLLAWQGNEGGWVGDDWEDEFRARIRELFEQMGLNDVLNEENRKKIDELLKKRHERYTKQIGEEWEFRRSNQSMMRLKDLGYAILDSSKVILGVGQGFYSDSEEMVCDYVSLSNWAEYQRVEGMTDEQVRDLAGCLAEAREKVGAAAELVTSERLGEICRALDVFRDEVLRTV